MGCIATCIRSSSGTRAKIKNISPEGKKTILQQKPQDRLFAHTAGRNSSKRVQKNSRAIDTTSPEFMELIARFELATSSLPRMRSTD